MVKLKTWQIKRNHTKISKIINSEKLTISNVENSGPFKQLSWCCA